MSFSKVVENVNYNGINCYIASGVQVKQRVRETCYLYEGGDTANKIVNCK